ncbi:GAF domain-containing hybrid sensor histidine kinase/response regulator [Parvularcula sp. IMCC14364]|uniref:hybrid sensor histidine kinase/response regulator n=1 Tax=Parvularcula sp. IMCC14364 TaxID=3067902 RepID=UPI002741084E|nr:GAF domain-containing hybrid sensor histidine kinase/response regulator [Parvularcula sp. IMCC14364]
MTGLTKPAKEMSDIAQRAYQNSRDKILLHNTINSQHVSVANAIILAILLINQSPSSHLFVWIIAVVSLTILRYAFGRVASNIKPGLSSVHRVTLDSFSALSGICWGLTPFLLPASAEGISRELVVFMIAGMTAGAALSYASHIRSVIAFNLPALSLLAWFHLLRGEAGDYVMCAVLAVYFFATLSLSRRASEVLSHAVTNGIAAQTREQELNEKEAALKDEVIRRKQKEEELKNTLARSQRVNLSLEMITKDVLAQRERSDSDVFDVLLRRSANALDVSRASIWLFTDDQKALERYRLFHDRRHVDRTPQRIEISQCPSYFQAISENRVVDASDSCADPRTRCLAEDYLVPLGIQSLLDAPIVDGKSRRGVICFEATTEQRSWTPDEVAFSGSIAQFIGMLLMADKADAMTESLRLALDEARHASATKSSFLANMSHEIRTPMNGVLGAAAALKGSDLDADQANLVDIIHGSGDSLMTVLNDILDFSKIEAGQVSIEQSKFSLRSVIEKVESVHGLKAADRGLEFSVAVEEGVADQLVGDSHRLAQILHNLVSNSIKFTHEGGVWLNVQAQEDDNDPEKAAILITVEDSGIGMTPEEKEYVFDKFAQADDSTTRNYGGTGLGLSIIQSLVEAMSGTLECESEKGRGTAFYIRLALPLAEGAEAEADEENECVVGQLAQKILLAEDNVTNRMVLEALLKPFDLSLTCVENGQEAVEAFQADRFDLILMDIQMPVMDGTEALAKIREIEAREELVPTPIIAATANAMVHQIDEYMSIGFDGHLTKPIRMDALMNVLQMGQNASHQKNGGQKAVSQRA